MIEQREISLTGKRSGQINRRILARFHSLSAIGALLLAGCSPAPHRSPPATLWFEGLPISGTLANAQAAGFTGCTGDAVSMRCRRSGVRLEGQGPYEAAVDLVGGGGSGGFDLLTLWNEQDQFAVQAVGDALKIQGWHVCMTGGEDRGDQEIYTRTGTPVRVSIDISYWGKRRLRLMPERNMGKPPC